MISKYDGTCCYCGKPTKANVDEYEVDSRKAWHIACHDNRKPGPEAFRLAEQLNFIGPGDPVPTSWITGIREPATRSLF